MRTKLSPAFLFIALSFVGCGRELNLTTPAKKPINLNENADALTISVNDFSSFATTFSMFWVPEENELVWDSPLYEKNDSYITKVSRIMTNIIRNSDEFDHYDQKILDLDKVKAPLTSRYEELECDFDYTDECAEIDTKIKEINAQATVTLKLPDGTQKEVDYEGYKSHLIEEIQASVDDYDRSNPELNKPMNWMLYGDAPTYEVRQGDNKSFKITFPKLGPFNSQNFYSTESGEIFDVKMGPSQYNHKVELLTFKIREKDSEGKFTSFIWEYTLERSFVVGKLRYKGDVLKVNPAGEIVRRGVCKIDFAKKGS